MPPAFDIMVMRQGSPDFLDLPWGSPLSLWRRESGRVVEVPRGLSRHEVVFVSYQESVYAFKELPAPASLREYAALLELEQRGLPAVMPVGHVRRHAAREPDAGSVLITRFLEGSLPYRTLFMSAGLERYRERLLDAMAGLLVRLHVGGFFWGDCSLSNTLFRRDAGELQAWVVDAETSEFHAELSDGQRLHDLEIMTDNVTGELADLAAVTALPPSVDVYETAVNIRARYDRCWHEINREVLISPTERYRIHERIHALNGLGFTVGEIRLLAASDGQHLRMRTLVTDRDYHRHQLHSLTGLGAGDRQSALLLDEIREVQATLRAERGHSIPLSVAAFTWLDQRFRPAMTRLASFAEGIEPAELYCQVLEHKWYLSERAGHDVGLEATIADYLAR